MLLSKPRVFYLIVILCSLAWHSLEIGMEARPPSTDVFLFKEAGVNLALKGRFVAANLPHLPPNEAFVFSYYPPAYPFVFGLWVKLFGVGLKQSMAFDAALRIVRTLLLFWLVTLFWKRQELVLKPSQHFWVAGCLLAVSLISTDGDRPDELALVFGLLSWGLLPGISWHSRRYWPSGVFLGLCGATSPAAAVLFGLGALGRVLGVGKLHRWVEWGIAVATVFLLCNLPIYLADPEAFHRFSRQVPLSTFFYLVPVREGQPWTVVPYFFLGLMKQWIHAGSAYTVAGLGLMGLTLTMVYRRSREERLRMFVVVPLVFLCIVPFVWTLQPYYLWFGEVALIAALLGLGLTGRTLEWAPLLLLGLLLPLEMKEVKNLWNVWQRPLSESASEVRREVLSHLGPGEKLAVSPDQYFTFRAFHEIDNVVYVCDRLESYAYVYLTRYRSQLRSADEVSLPCEDKRGCFSPVADLTSRKVLSVFGRATPYYVRGNGGFLYRNTACPASALSVNP
jgi:hypothetical protein